MHPKLRSTSSQLFTSLQKPGDIPLTTTENCFKKCGFSSGGEYINVGNDALNEQKDNWCSLKTSGVEFDEYVSCDASISVCEIQSVDQVIQDHLTCEEEEKKKKRRRKKKKKKEEEEKKNKKEEEEEKKKNLLRTK